MVQSRFAVAVVIGSVRSGRFGPTVASWFADRAGRREDVAVSVVDVAEGHAGFGRAIAAADAVVVVTPEYNHGYPGPLKDAVDTAGAGWRAKPVGLVTYGGMSGGLRAAEQLRQVFAELHSVAVRDTVSFHGASACFTESGEPIDPVPVNAAATALLDQLVWWAAAVRAGRDLHPYPVR